jgi:cell division protein FtsA
MKPMRREEEARGNGRSEPVLLAGLDMGSHEIRAVAGRLHPEGVMEIVAWAAVPSVGIRTGAVVHLEAAAEAVESVLRRIEHVCGYPVERLAVAMGDDGIRSFNSRGVVPVLGRDQEITEADKVRALEAAQSLGMPGERFLLHLLPQEFLVDGRGVRDPLGMWGTQLGAEVHLVTGLRSVLRNVQAVLERAGYRASRHVLAPLASARAVLHPDEERWGVAVVDVGAETTGVAVIQDGAVWDTGILGMGAARVTQDLAVGLRIPEGEAENLKRRWGLRAGREEAESEVPALDGARKRRVSPAIVGSIVGPRVEEMLRILYQRLRQGGAVSRLQGGIVLTGGGAELRGVAELAQRMFKLPVRVGRPLSRPGFPPEGLGASWACVVGLLEELAAEPAEVARPRGAGRLVSRLARPVREFVRTRLGL